MIERSLTNLPIRLSADLVHDGAKNASVALEELGTVWVGHIKVKSGVLGFQQGEQTTTD